MRKNPTSIRTSPDGRRYLFPLAIEDTYTYFRRVWLSLSRNSVVTPAEPPRVPSRAIRQVCIHTSAVARKHARRAQALLERATPTFQGMLLSMGASGVFRARPRCAYLPTWAGPAMRSSPLTSPSFRRSARESGAGFRDEQRTAPILYRPKCRTPCVRPRYRRGRTR